MMLLPQETGSRDWSRIVSVYHHTLICFRECVLYITATLNSGDLEISIPDRELLYQVHGKQTFKLLFDHYKQGGKNYHLGRQAGYCYIMLIFSRSVAQSHPTLCNPMDCSTPGFPVLHHLSELPQIHVH